MATIIPNLENGIPLRLYYSIESGKTADAEVISKAALSFVAGVREIAYLIDPSLQFQVGISGHADGSLWEDLLLLPSKIQDEYKSRPTRYNLALAAVAWIFAPPMELVRDNAWQPLLAPYQLDSENFADAERAIQIGASHNTAAAQKRAFYRELSRDTSVTGVGANLTRSSPPLIVPRSDFSSYAGNGFVEAAPLDRVTVGPLRVIIMSPVLEVSNRRWKFATAQGEFGAVVKDREFLERIVAGRTPVRMRGGVELDVQLETRERLIGGVWTIVERSVIHVDAIMEPATSRQDDLFPPNG